MAILTQLRDPRVSDDHYASHEGDVELKAAVEKSFEFDLPAGATLVTLVDDETGEPVVGGVAYTRPAASSRAPSIRCRVRSNAISRREIKVLLNWPLPTRLPTQPVAPRARFSPI